MMDPGPEDRLGIMMKLARALDANRCDEKCRVSALNPLFGLVFGKGSTSSSPRFPAAIAHCALLSICKAYNQLDNSVRMKS